MNFEMVKAWLEKQTAREIRNRGMLALLGIVLTPIGLAAGFCVVLFFAWIATRESRSSGLSPAALWIAVGSVPVMFVLNALIRPKEEGPEKLYHDDNDGPDGSVMGTMIHRRKVQGQFALWLLMTGPRLVDWWMGSLKLIGQLKRQDTHSCAAVLFVLLLKNKRTSYPDIQRELEWLDLEATLPQLGWIEGLMFINVEPPALSMTDDLRMAIRTGVAPP